MDLDMERRSPEVEAFDEDDDEPNEDEEDGLSDVDKGPNEKYKQENFRSFLQTDFNKIHQKCHLTNEKVSLKDVTFRTLEDSILAMNHVILCGLVSNLINFVLPLRAKHLTTYPPIVILNDHEPTEKQWNQICFFPEIYFVKGTALNQRDLIRANLMRASRVVILSPRVEEISKAAFEDQNAPHSEDIDQGPNSAATQQLSRDQEDLLDARTIFKYRNVIKLKPQMQIVTELVSP
jgi:potassium large conductance calcium-activated channel subfamily M alpha protein 1